MKELITWKDVIQALLRWIRTHLFPHISTVDLLTTPQFTYRIKPRTIMIGDVEVLEPVRNISELERGKTYYIIRTGTLNLYASYTWDGGDLGLRLLKHGLIHKSIDAAILHAKALIKISGGSYES